MGSNGPRHHKTGEKDQDDPRCVLEDRRRAFKDVRRVFKDVRLPKTELKDKDHERRVLKTEDVKDECAVLLMY